MLLGVSKEAIFLARYSTSSETRVIDKTLGKVQTNN